MKVVLLQKLADRMDGVDVRAYRVGDVLDLTPPEAHLLIAERWAIADRRCGLGGTPEVERRKRTERPHQDASDDDPYSPRTTKPCLS